uniref:Uncharacterized protein n=1 Tax=Anguilla anguilla TaxID=7936 RepID=A0A0E9TXM8_ANGAN
MSDRSSIIHYHTGCFFIFSIILRSSTVEGLPWPTRPFAIN